MACPMAEVASLLGRTLGHYRILEKIGEGGMGEVYRARDEHLDCDVAIKVLPADCVSHESARKRFHAEARALARLNHPNIAIIHHFDTQQGVDYLVMEYIRGTTLSEKLARGKLPEKEVVALAMQLAEGLCAAHEHGVIHSDLKPSNLRLTEDGRLKILDFGLAKLRLPARATATTASFGEAHGLAGTLAYMAPEQLLAGEVDARTDIHAAGCVFHEMATGKRAFVDAEASKLIGAILGKAPLSPAVISPGLSAELQRIIGKCLEKGPENRYQSARELVIDLRRLQMGTSGELQRATTVTRLSWAKSLGLGMGLVAALVLLLIGLNFHSWRERLLHRGELPYRIESLAVLPLANLSGDPQQEYFADGITEELITTLGKISSLRVISRQSVMRYRTTQKPLSEIARELGVDAVIEGSVLRSGKRVRVTANLLYAPTDRHLWANSYERDLQDVLSLQAEMAQAIAAEVRVKLTPEERARLTPTRPVNPAAFDAYLQGSYALNRIGGRPVTGIEYFRRAIATDPTYAQAYVGLCLAYIQMGFGHGPLTTSQALVETKHAAIQALKLDGTLAEAHSCLAWVKTFGEWDWIDGAKEFRNGIELNPNSVQAHRLYSWYLSAMQRHEEAIAEGGWARKLDPVSPATGYTAASAHWWAGQFQTFAAEANNLANMDVTYPGANHLLGAAALQTEHYEEAILRFQRAITLSGEASPPWNIAFLGCAYAQSGRRVEALQVLYRLQSFSKHAYVSPYLMAILHSSLGNKDKAFEWLQKGYSERNPMLAFLRSDPMFDSLRSDPRFQNLLHRMNFPK
jgi:eukaryotic-like serine/threonine-protein kinase